MLILQNGPVQDQNRILTKINGDVMNDIVHDPSKTVTIEKKNTITRNAKTKTIVNQDQTKTFSLGYDKRVVQDNFDTLPYGF